MQELILNALNGEECTSKLLKCPVCGYDCSHVFGRELEPYTESATRNGGYQIDIKFECGHVVQNMLSEHKGKVALVTRIKY